MSFSERRLRRMLVDALEADLLPFACELATAALNISKYPPQAASPTGRRAKCAPSGGQRASDSFPTKEAARNAAVRTR